MPTFFIHIHNGTGTQLDEVGSTYASTNVAIAEAAKMAGELLHDEVHTGPAEFKSRVVIEDEEHVCVAEVKIEIRMGEPGRGDGVDGS